MSNIAIEHMALSSQDPHNNVLLTQGNVFLSKFKTSNPIKLARGVIGIMKMSMPQDGVF